MITIDGGFFQLGSIAILAVPFPICIVERLGAAKDRYSAGAGPVLKQFGGRFIAGGAWDVLTGEPAFTTGAIIRVPDRNTAVAWYNSPKYQATVADRALGIDCRFQLIG